MLYILKTLLVIGRNICYSDGLYLIDRATKLNVGGGYGYKKEGYVYPLPFVFFSLFSKRVRISSS